MTNRPSHKNLQDLSWNSSDHTGAANSFASFDWTGKPSSVLESAFVPSTRTVNGKSLSSDISLSANDVGAPSGSGTSTGTNTGNETATTIWALIGWSADATPNDTDYVATSLTSGWILKKITWTNVKAFLKTYFDSLYATITQLLWRQINHWVEWRTAGSPLPTNLTTTTFNLTTDITPLTYWRNGVKTIVNTAKSVVLPSSTAGIYYIYFDDDAGTLSASATFPWLDSATTTKVLIATVDWNGSNYGIINDERHAYNRNWPLHVWAHNTIWTRYGTGLTLTHNGWTGAAMTGSVSAGNIYDEDINFAISTQTTFRQRYQTGATTSGYDTAVTTTPVKLGANNRPGYVDSTTFVWTQLASANNRYMNYFVYASTTMLAPIHVFSETVAASAINAGTGYNSLAAARAVPFPNISYYGLSPEFKPIYRLICRADWVLQAIDTTLDDYRTSSSIPFGAGTASTTAAAVSETHYWNVQAAVDTIITNVWWISTQSVVNSWTNYQAWSKWGLLLARFVGTASQGINVMSDATPTPTTNVATLTTNSNVSSDNSVCVPILPNYYYRIDMRWTWTWSWVFSPFQ